MGYKDYIKRCSEYFSSFLNENIKKLGDVSVKYLFLTIVVFILIVALLSISLNYVNKEESNYDSKLKLICANVKKKIVKFDLTGLNIMKIWEQKSPEDKTFELNSDTTYQEVYNQGCGGSEVFLD